MNIMFAIKNSLISLIRRGKTPSKNGFDESDVNAQFSSVMILSPNCSLSHREKVCKSISTSPKNGVPRFIFEI